MSVGRRQFLIAAGVVTAGTALGVSIVPNWLESRHSAPEHFQPHAFVRIASDGRITVIIGKSEMGQGIYTGLPMILAEELDIDPQRIEVEFAGVDPAFNHPFIPAQFTGGSMSTNSTYEALRRAGAAARFMLLQAAAEKWGTEVASLRTSDGEVIDSRGRKLGYGALATDAAAFPAPELATLTLKDPRDFKYIGKSQRRLDGKAKVTGQAIFGIDVQLPQMLTAVIARPPVGGGKIASFDKAAALSVRGVVAVKEIPSGIAVIAEHTYAALRGREALAARWDQGDSATLSTARLREEWRALSNRPGLLGRNVGDVETALRRAAKRIEVEYELPYLAHACMEPLNAAAFVGDDHCELWLGTQSQSQDAALVAAALGIDASKVKVNTLFLGGGFGRRASADSDFAVEAAWAARGLGKPVKVVWTREDDMRGGYYRPFSINRIRAGIDAAGMPVAYHHVTVGKPVLANTTLGKMAVSPQGLDPSSIEGSADTPYAFPNLRVEVHNTNEPIRNLWWRSVGHSINAFVVNGIVDELATLAGRDPYEYRRVLLAAHPRHLAVLDRTAREAGWGKPLPAGHYHGIALQESFGSIVAQVAQVSMEGGSMPRVHRVTCAVDCGLAINPDQVVAQMQSGIIYGLSAALVGEITIENGQAVQGNFDDYPVLRQAESPTIDVHIVTSDGPIGGIGEPGTPPIASAVCAAIFAATGQRIRRLPISAALDSAKGSTSAA